MSQAQLTLIEGGAASAPASVAPPRARRADPTTSGRAAQSIAARGDGLPRLILDAFAAFGEMTDDGLVGIMPGNYYAPTIKSARSRLTKAGLLVDTGKTKKSNRGQDMTVWSLA